MLDVAMKVMIMRLEWTTMSICRGHRGKFELEALFPLLSRRMVDALGVVGIVIVPQGRG